MEKFDVDLVSFRSWRVLALKKVKDGALKSHRSTWLRGRTSTCIRARSRSCSLGRGYQRRRVVALLERRETGRLCPSRERAAPRPKRGTDAARHPGALATDAAELSHLFILAGPPNSIPDTPHLFAPAYSFISDLRPSSRVLVPYPGRALPSPTPLAARPWALTIPKPSAARSPYAGAQRRPSPACCPARQSVVSRSSARAASAPLDLRSPRRCPPSQPTSALPSQSALPGKLLAVPVEARGRLSIVNTKLGCKDLRITRVHSYGKEWYNLGQKIIMDRIEPTSDTLFIRPEAGFNCSRGSQLGTSKSA